MLNPYKIRDSNECAGICLGGNHRPGSSPGLYTKDMVLRKVRSVKTDFASVTQRSSFGSYGHGASCPPPPCKSYPVSSIRHRYNAEP
jgi:hypothetical protein